MPVLWINIVLQQLVLAAMNQSSVPQNSMGLIRAEPFRSQAAATRQGQGRQPVSQGCTGPEHQTASPHIWNHHVRCREQGHTTGCLWRKKATNPRKRKEGGTEEISPGNCSIRAERKHAAMVHRHTMPLNLDLGISRTEKIPQKGKLFSHHL